MGFRGDRTLEERETCGIVRERVLERLLDSGQRSLQEFRGVFLDRELL